MNRRHGTRPALRPQRLAQWHGGVQWAALLLVSLLFAGVLELASLPAALLIGPMLAAIVAGTNGATIRVPQARLSRRRRRSSAA